MCDFRKGVGDRGERRGSGPHLAMLPALRPGVGEMRQSPMLPRLAIYTLPKDD